MNWSHRVEINPAVMLSKPVIRRTQVPVELILQRISEGATKSDLLESYPHLTPNDIRAAVGFAADLLAEEETFEPAVSG